MFENFHSASAVPVTARLPLTARGRALYTVAWALHDRLTERDYDAPGLKLTDLGPEPV